MDDQLAKHKGIGPMRFLAFANDQEDAEKEAKLKEAAAKIEQAIAKEKALNELIEYQAPAGDDQSTFDPVNDSRPLYERLLEQRNKKKEALEESQKLSNLVTKLDEDDVNHLNEVAKLKHEEELKKRLEIHDALEAKKRLEEQKMIEKEKRMKESLLGKTSQTPFEGKLTISTNKDKSIKSKLSSLIKVKPRVKPIDSSSVHEPDKPDTDVPKTSMKKTDAQLDQTSLKRANDDSNLKHSTKKQNTETQSDINSNQSADSSADLAVGVKTLAEHERVCSCPEDIGPTAGVLPSLPIQRTQFNSSSKDSSSGSDDEALCSRLVPRIRAGRKRKH